MADQPRHDREYPEYFSPYCVTATAFGILRDCSEQEDHPGRIRHSTIHKATGLDSTASWFMAVSRARQLLAVVECG